MASIKLSEFSQHLSSKELARALRSRVRDEKTVFDFTGVQTVSNEFLNELFGSLLESYGEKIFNDHVGWTGLSIGHQQLLSEVLAAHKHKR